MRSWGDLLTVSGGRLLFSSGAVEAGGVAAGEDDAHTAALGDVDDLLLRCAAEDGDAVLGGGEAHDDVEGLGVNTAIGAEDGKFADGNAGELLDDPAIHG